MRITPCLLAAACAWSAHAQDSAPARAAKAGDVHVYAVQQKADRTAYDETVTITAVEGGRIRASHARSDKPGTALEAVYGLDWGTYRSGTSGLILDPPSRVVVHPLEVGKSWEADYQGTSPTGGKLRIKMRSRVTAQEKLSTPAGEFQAWRIESEGYLNGINFPGGWGMVQKVWYAPAIDRIVRTEYREQRTMGADVVSELKAFKPAD